MAPWYELVLTISLKPDVPDLVINVLKHYLMIDHRVEEIPTPDHPFFRIFEWQVLLSGNSTAYFPGVPIGILTQDDHDKHYELTMRAMIRMNNSDLIARFVHWIAPYSATGDYRAGDFVGYIRCDETPHHIDLIYFEEGAAYFESVQLWKQPPVVERIKITEARWQDA